MLVGGGIGARPPPTRRFWSGRRMRWLAPAVRRERSQEVISQGGDPKGEIPRGRSQGRDLTGHSVHCKLYVVGSCCWVSRRSVTNLLRCGSAEWSGGGVWREVETVFVPWRDLRSSSMGEGAKEIDGADSQGTRVYE